MGEEDSNVGGPRRASVRRARQEHSIDVRSVRMGQSPKASQRKLPEEPSKLEMRRGAVQTTPASRLCHFLVVCFGQVI